MGVEVPERAEYIRLIAVELQRIASHLMWMGAYGPDTGNLSVMVWCLREREMMMDLLQELGGSRMHYNFPRIGGVRGIFPMVSLREPDPNLSCSCKESKSMKHFSMKARFS